jgi:hypothetical protein
MRNLGQKFDIGTKDLQKHYYLNELADENKINDHYNNDNNNK